MGKVCNPKRVIGDAPIRNNPSKDSYLKEFGPKDPTI